MISVLLNVPTTANDWERWSLHHDRDHAEIIQAIAAQGGPSLNQYQLNPIPPQEIEAWLERNFQAHNDMNTALGLVSSDLEEVSFDDEGQKVAWIHIHWQEHTNARNALGI